MNTKSSFKLSVLLLAVALCFALVACNPDTEPYPIPDALTVNVEIYDGETLLGTVTKDTLKELTQQTISMTTTNSLGTTDTVVYVAYSVKEAADKLGIALPATITSVTAFAADNYSSVCAITTLDNAYITVGTEKDGTFAADEKGPRFISDKNSGSSKSISKQIIKIVINPEEEPDEGNGGDTPAAALAYTVTPTWSSGGRVLSVSFYDVDAGKTNTIVLSTAESAAVTSISIDGGVPVELEVNLLVEYDDKGTAKYGYNLGDIIVNMGKFNKSGNWISFISDYERVEFVCSDDSDENDYSLRNYTKAEISNATESTKVIYLSGNTTRIVSSLSDSDPATYRNRLKNVTVINIYAAAE